MRRGNQWVGRFLLGSVVFWGATGAIGAWFHAHPRKFQEVRRSVESWVKIQDPTPNRFEAMTSAVLNPINYDTLNSLRASVVYTSNAQTGGSSLPDDSCPFLPKNFGPQAVLTNQDGDRINIRSGPGAEYIAINAGNRDDLVDVLQMEFDKDGCQWVKVRFGSEVEGWIRADFLNAEYSG